MTKKEALQILIQAGANDIGGQGQGFRSTSHEWRVKVSDAIRKLYKDAHDAYDGHIDFNLGLTPKIKQQWKKSKTK